MIRPMNARPQALVLALGIGAALFAGGCATPQEGMPTAGATAGVDAVVPAPSTSV